MGLRKRSKEDTELAERGMIWKAFRGGKCEQNTLHKIPREMAVATAAAATTMTMTVNNLVDIMLALQA